jgi:hypothetical protein
VDVYLDEETGVEQAKPNEETTDAPAAKEPLENTVDTRSPQFALFVTLIASVVLLIATGAEYDWKFSNNTNPNDPQKESDKYPGYAMSVSCIALILSFCTLGAHRFSPNLYAKVCKPVNGLLFLYSFIGACFLTFHEPFKSTSNGYFAAWVTAFGSALAVGMDAEAFRSGIKGMGSVMGLLTSSIVVIIACIDPIDLNDPNKNEAIYALALACVTAFFVVAVTFMDNRSKSLPGMVYFGCMAILAACWIIAACLVTFRGPFTVTGNGYFGSWASAATSSYAAYVSLQARDEW